MKGTDRLYWITIIVMVCIAVTAIYFRVKRPPAAKSGKPETVFEMPSDAPIANLKVYKVKIDGEVYLITSTGSIVKPH